MDKYKCIECNYTTSRTANYNRHIKSIKHIQKVSILENNTNGKKPDRIPKQIQNLTDTLQTPYLHQNNNNLCIYCNRSFSRPGTMSKHINTCKSKQREDNELKEKIKELNAQLELFKNEKEHYIDTVDQYKAANQHQLDETNYYKQLLREAGGLVKKSVSSLTYVVDNYENAPAIQTISVDEFKNIEENEKKIVEEILSAYKHKTLDKYLGNYIIKIYKKDDPKFQSIWNTDDSRLTYLIKELLSNKSSNWIIDKKGIKTKEYLIVPLLGCIKKLLISYQKNLIMPDLKQNSVEIEFILENNKKISELVNDIDDGVISKDVLKYISSHLRFDGKLLK